MAEIMLRIRLVGGGQLDVVCDEADAAADDIVEHAISILAEDDGALRCKHGEQFIVLFGRRIATVEAALRDAST
jgi:hypothetical protein